MIKLTRIRQHIGTISMTPRLTILSSLVIW